MQVTPGAETTPALSFMASDERVKTAGDQLDGCSVAGVSRTTGAFAAGARVAQATHPARLRHHSTGRRLAGGAPAAAGRVVCGPAEDRFGDAPSGPYRRNSDQQLLLSHLFSADSYCGRILRAVGDLVLDS